MSEQTLPPQHQDKQPGREGAMHPLPEYFSERYKAAGKLAGKVALITGGDSGICRAVAVHFAAEGAQVALVYLDEEDDAREEATQQALLGDDFSVTNAVLVIVTLISIDLVLTRLQWRWPRLDLWLEGSPVIVVEHGAVLKSRLDAARLREADILEAAREKHGLERLEQIRYAIVERNGKISIIPAQ